MPHSFRRATLADLDLIVSIARQAYAGQPVDWPSARLWASNLLQSPAVTCLIGERSVGFMLTMQSLWDSAKRAYLLPLFSLPGSDLEPLALLRELATLARAQNCGTLEASTETSHDVGILLQRLGAKSVPLWKLEL
jgi:hypothetical protein